MTLKNLNCALMCRASTHSGDHLRCHRVTVAQSITSDRETQVCTGLKKKGVACVRGCVSARVSSQQPQTEYRSELELGSWFCRCNQSGRWQIAQGSVGQGPGRARDVRIWVTTRMTKTRLESEPRKHS